MVKVHVSLTELNLSGNKIGDSICFFVPVFCFLNELKGDFGAKFLAEALRDNVQLTTLLLKGNGIGDEGLQAIGDMLASNATLQEVRTCEKKQPPMDIVIHF
jgi:hypothetical protein